jgi:hypothetical protein
MDKYLSPVLALLIACSPAAVRAASPKAEAIAVDPAVIAMMSDARVLAKINTMVTRHQGVLASITGQPAQGTQRTYTFFFNWSEWTPASPVQDGVGHFSVTVSTQSGKPVVVSVGEPMLMDD